MPTVGAVTLPDAPTWIVEPAQVDAVGRQLLDVALAGLTLYGRADRYDRVVVQHGLNAVVEPSKANQLLAVCTKVFVGRAGEEQFTFFKGAPGMLGFQTAQYLISVTNPWPKRQGTQPIPVTAINEAREGLWTDAFIVWNALMALALGGVTIVPPVTDSPAGVAVGPMVPKDPAGGEAGFVIECQVQL